ncbi:MAG: class I SAM-dependent methyltransferase [Gammaproteobacteria bacterium]|nr:class I SAM-dependent methyltransferase [Gammaproteobacteria bacterium]
MNERSDRKEFKDHFSAQSSQYASARPSYPPELFDWLAGQVANHQHAWDAATGNGQAAHELVRHFSRVTATDASPQQLEKAKAHQRIQFLCARSENSPLDSQSVDMITVAQAVHWFDMDAFNAEVERVLKPGGVVAVWAYGNIRVAPQIDAIEEEFYEQVVGDYWPDERRHIENGLADISLPWAELATPDFDMTAAWVPSQFTAYIGTWSAVQRYRAEKKEDPVRWLKQQLLTCWGPGERRKVRWPLHLKVARKPS